MSDRKFRFGVRRYYKTKTFRNVRIGEILSTCNSVEDCSKCPFEAFCQCVSLLPLCSRLNNKVRLERKCVYKRYLK